MLFKKTIKREIISNWKDKYLNEIFNNFVLWKRFFNDLIFSYENDKLNNYFDSHLYDWWWFINKKISLKHKAFILLDKDVQIEFIIRLNL